MPYEGLEGKMRQIRGCVVVWNNSGRGGLASEIHAGSQMVLYLLYAGALFMHATM